MRMLKKIPQSPNLPRLSHFLGGRIIVSLQPSMKAAYEDAQEETHRENEIVFGVPTDPGTDHASLSQAAGRISRIILVV